MRITCLSALALALTLVVLVEDVYAFKCMDFILDNWNHDLCEVKTYIKAQNLCSIYMEGEQRIFIVLLVANSVTLYRWSSFCTVLHVTTVFLPRWPLGPPWLQQWQSKDHDEEQTEQPVPRQQGSILQLRINQTRRRSKPNQGIGLELLKYDHLIPLRHN